MNKIRPIPPDVQMMEYSLTKRGVQKKKPMKFQPKALQSTSESSSSRKRQKTAPAIDPPADDILNDSFVDLDYDLPNYTGNVSNYC